MDYVVIKLYTNEIQGDIHDINIDNLVYQNTLQQMMDLAKQHGKKLFFMPIANDGCLGVPVDGTPFAEIEYTTSISEVEKKTYIECLKTLVTDANIENKKGQVYLDEFCTLTMVKFKKIDDEIVEI